MVTEVRQAQRLPVLEHEGKATIVTECSEELFVRQAVAVQAYYEVDWAQYHATLFVRFRKPRHRKYCAFNRTGESVCVAVLSGHHHSSDEISRCTAEHFTPEIFVYENRQAAVWQSAKMNSILSYCRQHQSEVLALELFGWNFFESHYPDEQRRYSCGCENMKKNKPTGLDCLKAIFPDRWQQVEKYQQKIQSWRASAAV
jgi:hypothetical protein